jgi:NAD-dependent deacetylase
MTLSSDNKKRSLDLISPDKAGKPSQNSDAVSIKHTADQPPTSTGLPADNHISVVSSSNERADDETVLTKGNLTLAPIQKMNLIILSGAGISAESGLGTFRGAGGLWEGVSVMEVASLEAWKNNPEGVLRFYNERRRAMLHAEPNEAHRALARLEDLYDVTIITQNVDDLHERAGSSRVIHLHGEIAKAQSSIDPSIVLPWRNDIQPGDRCPLGSQLRPFVVMLGEQVRSIHASIAAIKDADFLIVVGTSLEVFPAASLLHHVPRNTHKYIVDPSPRLSRDQGFTAVRQPASIGIPQVTSELTEMAQLVNTRPPGTR